MKAYPLEGFAAYGMLDCNREQNKILEYYNPYSDGDH